MRFVFRLVSLSIGLKQAIAGQKEVQLDIPAHTYTYTDTYTDTLKLKHSTRKTRSTLIINVHQFIVNSKMFILLNAITIIIMTICYLVLLYT